MKSREKDFRTGGEPSDPEIITVPDCAYTIPELLQKFTRGVVPSIAKTPEFSDGDLNDDVIAELARLDFDQLDAYELGSVLQDRISHFKAQNNQQDVSLPTSTPKGEETPK